MYLRIYNDELIRVYTKEDLSHSDIIGKLKGRDPAGFTIRDKNSKIIFYDIHKISAKELQLIVRNIETATIAIKLTDEEVVEYFYMIAKIELIEHNRIDFMEDELYEWMLENIDSGILHSAVWIRAKPKMMEMLLEQGFIIEE